MINQEPPEQPKQTQEQEQNKKLEQAKKQYERLYILLKLLSILDDYQTENEKKGINLFNNEDFEENWKNMIRAIFGDPKTGEYDKRAKKMVDQYELSSVDDDALLMQLQEIARYWFERKKILPPHDQHDSKTSKEVINDVANFIRHRLFTEGADIKSFLGELKAHGGKKPDNINPTYAYERLAYGGKDWVHSSADFQAQLNYLQKLEQVLDAKFFNIYSEEKASQNPVRYSTQDEKEEAELQEKSNLYFLIRDELLIVSKFLKYFQKYPDLFHADRRNNTVRQIFSEDPGFELVRKSLIEHFTAEGNEYRKTVDQAIAYVQTLIDKWLTIVLSRESFGDHVEPRLMKSALQKVIARLEGGLNPPEGSNKHPLTFLKDLKANYALNPADYEMKMLRNEMDDDEQGLSKVELVDGLHVVKQFLELLHFRNN